MKPLNTLVWFLQQLPYKPFTLNRKRFVNARSAGRTIEIIEMLGLKPTVLVDVGANESQWAYWLLKKYPKLWIHSFEPNMKVKPLGDVWRVALSNVEGTASLTNEGTSSHIIAGTDIPVRRFESVMSVGMTKGDCILKVDAETHTAKALEGFGKELSNFDVVVVEVCGDSNDNKSLTGQRLIIDAIMVAAGFRNATIVDAGYDHGVCDCWDMCYWK